MSLKHLLRTCARALAVAVLPLVAVIGLGAAGCGQDVPSCGTVCSADSSGDCSTRCASMQSQCDAANASADFQELLTCLGNAGFTYDDVPPLCEAAQTAVTSSCSGAVPVTNGSSG